MAGRLGVMIIHGMGAQKKDFADGLIENLKKRLGGQAADVEFMPCFWADILQKYEDKTWERLLSATRMDARRTRRFIVSALGDAAGYLAGYFKDGHYAYDDIHEEIRSSLQTLEQRLKGSTSAPLLVLAHSLGSVMVSNYIWDEQTGKGIGKTSFEKMQLLCGFITFGSNIPLFLPPRNIIECIRFPDKSLPQKYRNGARWVNAYDPDDILGYPLSTIWTKQNGTSIEDVLVNAGPPIISETPLSHMYYEKTAAFQKIVIAQIKSILAIT